jgi:hypothetical protein
MSDLETTADPPLDATIGVWHDLEMALAGKNGYGGDVAEIYAYRLVPGGAQAFTEPPLSLSGSAAKSPQQAILAGRNLTRLAKQFADLHHANIAIEEGQRDFRTIDFGCEELPPFDWRIHLRVTRIAPVPPPAPPIHEVRRSIEQTSIHLRTLLAMLDELGAHRAKQRLGVDVSTLADDEGLPPDGATGLYLDVPFDEDDPEWIKRAFDALTNTGGAKRPGQLMLVFQAIRYDSRATAEFVRAMNTIVLPFLRRTRLRDQPQLRNLGAASE